MLQSLLELQNYLWWLEGIFCRKMNIQEKYTSLINGAWWPKDCRHPFIQIITFRTSTKENKTDGTMWYDHKIKTHAIIANSSELKSTNLQFGGGSSVISANSF